MRALVCDCCGKVELLTDNPYANYNTEISFHRLEENRSGEVIEVCDACFKKLVHALVEVRGDGE